MQWGAGGDSASRVFWKPSGSPDVTHNAFVPGFLARRARKETEMGTAGLTLLKRDRQVSEQGFQPILTVTQSCVLPLHLRLPFPHPLSPFLSLSAFSFFIPSFFPFFQLPLPF